MGRRLIVTSCAALVVALLCGTIVAGHAHTERDPSYTCIVGSSASQTQGEILWPEAGPAEAAWQWWPMGTACSWETTLGVERIVPGWGTTGFAGVAALGGFVFVAAAARALRRRTGRLA